MRSIALKGAARKAYLKFIDGLEGDFHPRKIDASALLGNKNRTVDPLLDWRLQGYRFF